MKKEITPYTNSSSKKTQIEQMFNNIAKSYDLNNRVLSLGIDTWWRKRTVRKLAKYNPKYILDIATGTADLAIAAANVIKPTKIVGIDIAQQMLSIGINKIKRKNLNAVIDLEYGDSENMRFVDKEFDAVMAGFGVRNFENLELGLSEMYRVLKDNGVCVILEFSRPKIFPIKQLFNLYFKYISPVIAKIKSKDEAAYDYLYKSVQAFPEYEEFESVLRKVGFNNISWSSQTFGICTIYISEK